MTIKEAFKYGIEILKNSGNEAPAIDAGVLLCSAAGCDRASIYAHGDNILDDAILHNYLDMLGRRAGGVPLQYITGMQEFMSLPFEVGPGVLVPRQDTELLVETVIGMCRDIKEAPEILDIGTGSGCIAISLAHYIPGCRVTAVDRMPDALAIAQRNAFTNGVPDRVEFVASDLFEAVSGRRFDAIVSNPPYIRTGDISSLQKEVRRHEPLEALDGGADGLYFYREIIGHAPEFLRESGVLAFETGYDQAQDVAELMSDKFRQIKIYKDLAGIERVVAGICM